MKQFLTPFLFFMLAVLAGFPIGTAVAQKRADYRWKALFNGKDLSGWGTYLRGPLTGRNETMPPPLGLNNDPHGVFKAENGMIHVSGQDWGGVFTNESFQNYHLRFQVKFGQKKWPPRLNVPADGGLLFHCSLPYDYGTKCWMRSVEFQIQETDIGDYHNVGAGVPLMQFTKSKDDNVVVDQYDPSAAIFQPTTSRVYRSGNFESAPDQWTTGELVARGADAVFIVNGFVVNRLFNLYRTDLYQQTTSGQLQFQSEGAEHFLKNIELRSIDFTPKAPKLVPNQPELLVSEREPQTLEITNAGEAVELIAVELIGKNLEQYTVQLPQFPLVVKKGGKLTLPVSVKPGAVAGSQVKLRLETILGPVPDFLVGVKVK